jgi:hypothetical protein
MTPTIDTLANLIGGHPATRHPWHDAASGRDCVTCGTALLTWDGHAYAEKPDDVRPPDLAGLLVQQPELGRVTVLALYTWSMTPTRECGECECSAVPVVRCGVCGDELPTPARPALLFGRRVDRELLALYLGAVSDADSAELRICAGPEAEAAIQIIGRAWTIVLMPMRGDSELGEPLGDAPAAAEVSP